MWVPWWWWPLGVAAAALVAMQFAIGIRSLPPVLPFLILAPVPLWLLWRMSRTEVAVVAGADGEAMLHAGKARLPVSVIDRVAAIPPSAKQAAMGRQLDPSAYVVHRAWISALVLVVLDDPEDPTPYWLVSTRNPDALVAALEGHRSHE
nr:DUF3093 domain-containing protein [Lolliginicoccus lacisalsi]